MNLEELVEPITALAVEAGNAILTVYATDFDVESKSDDSPLTQADLASHNCIAAGLARLTPDIPIISEEDGLPEFDVRGKWNRYWLIDPLDFVRAVAIVTFGGFAISQLCNLAVIGLEIGLGHVVMARAAGVDRLQAEAFGVGAGDLMTAVTIVAQIGFGFDESGGRRRMAHGAV